MGGDAGQVIADLVAVRVDGCCHRRVCNRDHPCPIHLPAASSHYKKEALPLTTDPVPADTLIFLTYTNVDRRILCGEMPN